MPCLKIFTNLQRSSIPNDFMQKLLPVLSRTVNKPEDRFIVTVNTDVFQSMDLDGSAPSIVASLESIGNLGPERNNIIAGTLTDFIVQELGVRHERIFVTFYDLDATNVAKGGKTVG